MAIVNTLTFGSTVVNLATVVTMSEEEFKSTFAGVLNVDINDAWKEVKKHQPKKTATQAEITSDKPKKKKKYFKSGQ